MASLTQLPSILSLSTPFPGFFWKSNCVLVKILRSSPGLNRNSALKLWNNIQFVLHKVAPLGIGFQEVFISTSCIEIDVTRQTTSPQIWNYHRLITHWISSGETKRVSKSLRDEEEGSSVPSLGSVTWIWTQTPATACCSLTWVSRAFVEKERAKPAANLTWLAVSIRSTVHTQSNHRRHIKFRDYHKLYLLPRFSIAVIEAVLSMIMMSRTIAMFL